VPRSRGSRVMSKESRHSVRTRRSDGDGERDETVEEELAVSTRHDDTADQRGGNGEACPEQHGSDSEGTTQAADTTDSTVTSGYEMTHFVFPQHELASVMPALQQAAKEHVQRETKPDYGLCKTMPGASLLSPRQCPPTLAPAVEAFVLSGSCPNAPADVRVDVDVLSDDATPPATVASGSLRDGVWLIPIVLPTKHGRPRTFRFSLHSTSPSSLRLHPQPPPLASAQVTAVPVHELFVGETADGVETKAEHTLSTPHHLDTTSAMTPKQVLQSIFSARRTRDEILGNV